MSISVDSPQLQKILEIENACETGTLLLQSGVQNISIVFRHGWIEAASSNIEDERLGRHLLAYLDSDQFHHLLADSRRLSLPLGECAHRSGLIDKADILEAITQQVSGLVTLAVEGGFSVRSFSREAPAYALSPQLNLDRLLLGIARRHAGALPVPPGHRIFIDERRDLSRFDWLPQELAVLAKLREFPPTFDELIEGTGAEARMVCKILSVLEQLALISVHQTNEITTALVKTSRFPLELLIPKVQSPEFDERMEVVKHPSSFTTEQFKWLKVRIREMADDGLQIIGVTSPWEKDGKSLISANLAMAFSEDLNRRVALVDCDLRRPSIQKYMGVPFEPGLLGYLEPGNTLPAHCFMRRVDKLFLLTSGGHTDNPVELLSSEKMHDLLDFLRREFDTVVFDCPPSQPIADTQILSQLADAMLLVIRRGGTPYRSIERALGSLDKNKLLGVVFNDVKPEPFHTYYDYGYYYGHKNGYSGNSKRAGDVPVRKKRRRSYLDKI